MINILEILKKVPNLEDMVFYSPLYGDVKVSLDNTGVYSIWVYPKDDNSGTGSYITNRGIFLKGYDGECMLYPSRQQRDWSKFKIPKEDLPRDTPVLISDHKIDWRVRKYARNGTFYSCIDDSEHISCKYIIPVDKFNFEDWSFKEEDNYGSVYKEE